MPSLCRRSRRAFRTTKGCGSDLIPHITRSLGALSPIYVRTRIGFVGVGTNIVDRGLGQPGSLITKSSDSIFFDCIKHASKLLTMNEDRAIPSDHCAF